ncbi:MAG: hypothetical protein WCC99_02535 [Candidatus Sulfotelmatobacter sp.]
MIAARYEIELRIVFWMGRDGDTTTSPAQLDYSGPVLVTRSGTFVVTPRHQFSNRLDGSNVVG